MSQYGKYPDAFYRVTAKAIVKDDRGFVLAVWDKDGFWNIPGGGIDHGDTVEGAMARELEEELGYKGEMSVTYSGILTYHSPGSAYCLMHIFYDVKLPGYSGGTGRDATTAEFIDPVQFKNSSLIAHQFIYKFGYDRDLPIAFDE